MKKSKLFYLDKEGKKNKVKTRNLADMKFEVKNRIKYKTKNDFEIELNNFLFFYNICNRQNLLLMVNKGILSPFTVGETFYDFSTEGKIKIANLYSIILAPEGKEKDLQIFRSDDELNEFLKYLKKLKCKEIDFSEKAITNKYFYNLQEFFMVSAKFDCSLEDVKNKIENMFNSI